VGFSELRARDEERFGERGVSVHVAVKPPVKMNQDSLDTPTSEPHDVCRQQTVTLSPQPQNLAEPTAAVAGLQILKQDNNAHHNQKK
jgi:hypothetical protein